VSGGTEIAECMFDLARRWKIYVDTTVRPGPAFPPPYTALGHGSGETVLITRCQACGEEIFGTGDDGFTDVDVIRHLLNSHGYRMDGRQFDNQNNEVGHA
jgi:hypothetical protein